MTRSASDSPHPLLRAGLALLLLAALACAGPARAGAPQPASVSPLLGVWIGEDETRFDFRPDGSALWIFPQEPSPDTFAIRYHFDPDAPHPALDLLGFDRGLLEGRVLYCIVEFPGSERLRMNCRPGAEESAAARVRPSEFGRAHTRTYHRLPAS